MGKTRLLAIGGEPAAGKTSLMLEVMRHYPCPRLSKFGTLFFHTNGRAVVLGKYLGGDFQGTDKLAMNVQPKAEEYLRSPHAQGQTILFEGDRLFNIKFLTAAINAGVSVRILVLLAEPGLLKARHIQRGDSQTDSWLAGRATKLRNVMNAFPNLVELRKNYDMVHMTENVAEIVRWATQDA